jgi:hypothetical protein
MVLHGRGLLNLPRMVWGDRGGSVEDKAKFLVLARTYGRMDPEKQKEQHGEISRLLAGLADDCGPFDREAARLFLDWRLKHQESDGAYIAIINHFRKRTEEA